MFCKGFSCSLRITHIITERFAHRFLSPLSLMLGSFFSHREHGGHGGFKRTYSFVESFFSHRAHRVHWAFWRTFRAHRTPPAYRVHRALLLKVAVTFCEIGWLNVSVECCVLCSSVFFCEKKNAPSLWDETRVNRWGVLSLTKDFSFSHRTHRFNRAFLRTISIPQNASGIQISQRPFN